MYTYIISWCLVVLTSMPCPDANRTDEFGRRSIIGCLAYHYKKTLDCGNEKVIYNRKDAYEFYSSAKNQGDIEMVKIDSIYNPIK